MFIKFVVNTIPMKNLIFTSTLLLVVSCYAAAQQKPINQALADSLAQWTILDQAAAGPPHGKTKDMNAAEKKRYSDSVFALNEKRLNAIFERYGYPGYSLVGKKESNDFWLMTQHCDHDVAFQEKVLVAMRAKVGLHDADAKNFAYLTDRVRVNTGRRQLYGTQVTYNVDSCQAVPKPLEDSSHVNERRKQIGMESLESYLNWMSQAHFEMNKAVYEKKGIHHAKFVPAND